MAALRTYGTRSKRLDRKSTRLNSSHSQISYAVFCLKKKKKHNAQNNPLPAVSHSVPRVINSGHEHSDRGQNECVYVIVSGNHVARRGLVPLNADST